MKTRSLMCISLIFFFALIACNHVSSSSPDNLHPVSKTMHSLQITPQNKSSELATLSTLTIPATATSIPKLSTGSTVSDSSTLTPTAKIKPTSTTVITPTATNISVETINFASAMRPAFRQDVIEQAALPHYTLQMTIDTRKRQLFGRVQIDFTNHGTTPLNNVALRLYPNFPQDVFGRGGNTRMTITQASIAGQTTQVQYVARDTAIVLPFAKPLSSDQSITLLISFTATIRPAVDGTWPLPSYYPILAVRDGDSWRLDVTRFPDRVYAESAFYTASITAPSTLMLVSSGSIISSKADTHGNTIHMVSTGPAREFALSLGNFSIAHERVEDVDIRVYTARGSSLNAQQVAQVAANAIRVFDRRFGSYPYQELDIHLLPGPHDGGDEYPGFILLTSDKQVDEGTRYVTAHEVAHQWWYGVVGNDIYRNPWLDEAFAQYSGIIYDEEVASSEVATADWNREILRRYNSALADGDLPIGLGITDYPNFNVYYHTVYGKGAIFLRKLREELGDDTFFQSLQNYYWKNRYRVATTADLQRAFEDTSQRDLSVLFQTWVVR